MKRSHAIIEVDLLYPFKTSLEILNAFINEWGCKHVSAGTNREVATFAMDDYKFAMIWAEPPRVGRWRVPEGTEHFLTAIRVIDVRDMKIN